MCKGSGSVTLDVRKAPSFGGWGGERDGSGAWAGMGSCVNSTRWTAMVHAMAVPGGGVTGGNLVACDSRGCRGWGRLLDCIAERLISAETFKFY